MRYLVRMYNYIPNFLKLKEGNIKIILVDGVMIVISKQIKKIDFQMKIIVDHVVLY